MEKAIDGGVVGDGVMGLRKDSLIWLIVNYSFLFNQLN